MIDYVVFERCCGCVGERVAAVPLCGPPVGSTALQHCSAFCFYGGPESYSCDRNRFERHHHQVCFVLFCQCVLFLFGQGYLSNRKGKVCICRVLFSKLLERLIDTILLIIGVALRVAVNQLLIRYFGSTVGGTWWRDF
jgi:hypothetical protein